MCGFSDIAYCVEEAIVAAVVILVADDGGGIMYASDRMKLDGVGGA